jgi:photosystem II stability/assembly factor-like uncharacterized protein
MVSGIRFLDAQKGWLYGYNGGLYWTEDGGLTWVKKTVPFESELGLVFFADEHTGWAEQKETGAILRTDDGGNSWQTCVNLSGKGDAPNTIDLLTLFFASRTRGWAIGSGNEDSSHDVLLRTDDGGHNWTRTPLKLPGRPAIIRIHFSEEGQGWLWAASNDYEELYRTVDSGGTWLLALRLPTTMRD